MFFEEAWATHMDRADGFRIFGSHGGVTVEPFGFYTDLADMQANVSFDVGMYEGRESLYHGDAHKALRHQQMNLVWSLLGRVPLLDTAPIAVKVAEITEAMYKSADSGREVRLAGAR
jgi:predicted dehydrogenase